MMKKLFCLLAMFAFLIAVGIASHAQAQNLLYNGDLELTPADVYYDGFDPSLADDVPGWNLFLGAADGSYVLVNGVGSGNTDVDMGIGPSGGGLETAPLSRPAVVPGVSYTATLTYDNYFAPADPSYFIDWYDGGGSYISSDGGLLPDPNGPFGYDPYVQLLSISGIAPGSAATAGVRFVSGNPGYAGLAADNFRLVVPEPTSFVMIVLASLALLAVPRRGRP
jgi:hypothetical protein